MNLIQAEALDGSNYPKESECQSEVRRREKERDGCHQKAALTSSHFW